MNATTLCDRDTAAYSFPFKMWDSCASVRSFVNENEDWSNFSDYWMPITPDSVLSHEAIPELIKKPLSAHLLLGSLDFTYSLEQRLISQVSSSLASDTLLPDLSEAVKVDALKVQCDEAFHALQAYRIAKNLRRTCGIDAPMHTDSHFLRFVNQITDGSIALSRELLLFCSVVVSETLITKSLRDDWRDSSLPQAIRSFFHQHYKDEVQHSAYFSWLLQHVWPTWSVSTQRIISELWPQLIDAYLDSDIEIAKRALQCFSLTDETIEQVIHDTYYDPQAPYQTQRQLSVVHTIEAFEHVQASVV